MEIVFKVSAICIVAVLLLLLLRPSQPAGGMLLMLGLGVLVLVYLLSLLRPLLGYLLQMIEETGMSSELFIPLLKTLGIALVVKLGGGLCRDSGASSAAALIEMAGAFCALLISLPVLKAVLQLFKNLL